MPYAAPHNLVTWFGDGWSQQEEWQFGLRLSGAPVTPTGAQMTALRDAAVPLFTAIEGGVSDKVRYLGVKHAKIAESGLYVENSNTTELLMGTPKLGPIQTTAYPQITYAVTLQTAVTRGLASKGRIYPPAVTLAPAADGRIATSAATQYGNLYKTFIAAVNNVGIGTVAVMSKGSTVGATPGVGRTENVTAVRVGRVADTQRRRRAGIAEQHVAVPLT